MPAARCPHCGHDPLFESIGQSVLSIIAEGQEVDPVLQKVVDAARELVGARFAALGMPDPEGGFEKFITSGLSDALMDAIGPLPRTHGVLGRLFTQTEPFMLEDIEMDPEFSGYPEHHPRMKSFLGIPIAHLGDVIGALFLSDKAGGQPFDNEDAAVITRLAAQAAVAIENARLHEQSRELSVVEERTRLARELHDSVSQTLFSAVLTGQAAVTLLDREPHKAKEQMLRAQELVKGALHEMRSLIFELRPGEVEEHGLVPTLQKHLDVVRRLHHLEGAFEVSGEGRMKIRIEKELFRIAQEALNNAVKHAQPTRVDVSLQLAPNQARLEVTDDGIGFDSTRPAPRSRHLGLTSMEERARALGAKLSIETARGEGTKVVVEVPINE